MEYKSMCGVEQVQLPMSLPEQKIIGRRYVLQQPLGAGGMGAVFLTQDRLTGTSVALKRVIRGDEQRDNASTDDSMDFRLALAQEFKVLASLRHPNIISVIDYGFDDERHPFYTMELLEHAETVLEAGEGRSQVDKVNLLVQILQALTYLHRRGILHRDLKPRNVLVANGQVKVLDFGLSVNNDQSDADLAGTAGTLAYMAPEILTGGVPSEAADLYAVGIMAYELLVGVHPYYSDNMSALVNNILLKHPDLSPFSENPHLSLVMGKLLSKTLEGRYTTARQVIVDLSEAIDQPIPVETAATRESFLQAARLIGRDTELARLTEALGDAIDGQGSSWLISGESGVGKSRLLDELRAIALVRGALVLRGRSVTEGGSPYFLWRPVLRWLALLSELPDKKLAVLKSIIPDLNTLLGREIDDVTQGSVQVVQNALINVIEELFREQKQPIVVILEDLQWSDDSLDVLVRLNQIVSDLPLLIVGSYRDDERQDLLRRLPDMNAMRLERLDGSGIAQLSEAMLGEAGKQPHVVDLLQRETEGNVFFLVEVVRALAEEAGQLDRIGMTTLPVQVFAGGVQQVITHRLGRVPAEAHPLLQIAAVMGREFDIELLHVIAPDTDLTNWLTLCSDAAVLEVADDEWRFAHDKLRDGVLQELTPDGRAALHGQVATGMETLYRGSTEHYPLLAYHYGRAGDAEKEAHYTELAGGQCLRSGAYRDSITYYERCLHLLNQHTESDEAAQKIRGVEIKQQIAKAHLGMGEYAKARALYMENLGTSLAIPYQEGVAEALMSLGDVGTAMGEWEKAKKQYEEGLEIYRELDNSEGIAKALNSLGNVAYESGEVDEAKALFQQSLSLSRGTGGGWGMAGAMSNTGGSGDAEYARAKQDFRDALNTYITSLKDPNNRPKVVSALHKLTAVTNDEDYGSTNALLQENLAYFQQSGDNWGKIIALSYLGRVACNVKQFSDARKFLLEALVTSTSMGETRLSLDVLIAFGQLLVAKGEKARAVELLALVLHHPDSDDAIQDEAEKLLFELEADVDPILMTSNWEKGKSRKLEDVIKELSEQKANVPNKAAGVQDS